MKLTAELKAKIDSMSYEQLLTKNRFEPVGSPFWQDESGDYAFKALARRSCFTGVPISAHAGQLAS